MSNVLARTSYVFKGVDVRVILVDDTRMHNVDAIWKGAGSPGNKSPDEYLRRPDSEPFRKNLAASAGVPEDQLSYYDGRGWWFTQVLAIEYAGWISPVFRQMVIHLAVDAAQHLAKKTDPVFQQVRHQGKLAHQAVSDVRGRYDPIVRDGKDIKFAIASSVVSKELLGDIPSGIREDKGLKKNVPLWDTRTLLEGAMRCLSLVCEIPKQEEALRRTRDPNVMIEIARKTARSVKEATRQIERA